MKARGQFFFDCGLKKNNLQEKKKDRKNRGNKKLKLKTGSIPDQFNPRKGLEKEKEKKTKKNITVFYGLLLRAM